MPHLKPLFSSPSRRVVGEYHAWHLSTPGHVAAGLPPAAVKRTHDVLCRRDRTRDRVEWLTKPEGCPRTGS